MSDSYSSERKLLESKLSLKGYIDSGGIPNNRKSAYSTINLEAKDEFYKPPSSESSVYIKVSENINPEAERSNIKITNKNY